MKKTCISTVAVSCVIAMLCGILSVVGASAAMVTVYEPKTNVASGKSYKASAAFTANPPAMGYQSIDGKELTDGVLAGTDLYASCWHGFDHRIESPMYATVDLGAVTSGLILFRLQFINIANSGIDAPSTLEFFVSDNGTDFTSIGKGKAMSKDKFAYYGLKLSAPVSARYVKAVIGNPKSGVFVFCSEFEIYDSVETQKDESELSEEEEESEEVSEVLIDKTSALDTEKYSVAFREGSRFEIDGDKIYGVIPGDTAADVLRDLVTIAGVRVFGDNGNELTSGKIHSGDRLVQSSGGEEVASYTLIIPSDANNDAELTALDFISMRLHILGINLLTGDALTAADIDRNKTINTIDYINARLHLLGVNLLYNDNDRLSKGVVLEEDGSLEVGETMELQDMKITMNSQSLYTMTTTASNGKALSLTFDKKTWGTWNIGTLKVGGLALAGGGTDWEYVYRAGETNSSWVWSGGNHGNETLIDLTWYNGVTGEPLVFSSTVKSYDVQNLILVEKTRLHWGDETKYYAEVTRKYTIVGQKISLDVHYKYTRDCYFQLSYTCMFPVPKTVGLYIDFLGDNGNVRTVETLKVGAADYSGKMYEENASSACRIYGYQNTEYSFLTQVYTKEASLQSFKNTSKVFYWDMNTTQNKLYYSKFPDSSMEKVTAGTELDTACSWELLIENAE